MLANGFGSRLLGALALAASLGLIRSNAADSNWPGWRGPSGDGHSAETGLPVHWGAHSVVWRSPLPGRGQSSPVLWGDRIFLTTALEDGRQRVVLCVDRRDGKLLWQHVAWTGTPEKSHPMNGWASPTCATDGKRVVAFFGKGGIHCCTVEGKPLWSRDLGPFAGPWGTASSPVILGDLVVQNCDAEQEAFLIALDKRTGRIVWRTQRDAPDRGGWSTPVLVRAGGRDELVLNGAKAVTAYDPTTGKSLWSCRSFNGRGEPTATPGHGLVFLINGLQGDMYAVRPGGAGDVTRTRMAWHTPRRSGRDQPSPIVVGDDVLVSSMDGILTCYEAATGKELWKERLDGRFTSSPVAAGGLAYFQSDDGTTFVVAPGPAPRIIARNEVGAPAGETFRAALALSAGQVFARSDRALYGIGGESGKSASGSGRNRE